MSYPAGHSRIAGSIFSAPTALILAREFSSRISSAWFYVVTSAICLIAWWYGGGFQAAFNTESVAVTDNPLKALNAMIVAFCSFVVGLRLSTSLAWEREHGTLQLLLSGPADWLSILGSKFLTECCVLLILLAIYQAYLLIAQPLGPSVLMVSNLLSLAAIAACALPLVALGLLISSGCRTVRAAVVTFLVVVLILGAFEMARIHLLSVQPTEASLTELYLRAGIETVAPYIAPVSAASYIAMIFESVAQQAPLRTMDILSALGLSAVTFVAACFVAKARGVS